MTNPVSRWLGKYRWLLLLLAVVGLTADQWSKYGMFRWLYHDGQTARDGAFEAWNNTAPAWVAGTRSGIEGGRYDVLPGWFGFVAMYNPPLRKLPDGAVAVDPKTGEPLPPSAIGTDRLGEPYPADSGIQLPRDDRGNVVKSWRYDLQACSAPRSPHVNRGALFGMGAKQDGRVKSPEELVADEAQAESANTLFAVVSLIAAGGILLWAVLRGHKADAWISAALGLILGGTVGNLFDRVVFHGVRDFLFFYKIDWPVFNVADCCLVCGAIMLVLHALFVKHPAPVPAATAAAEVPANSPSAPTVA